MSERLLVRLWDTACGQYRMQGQGIRSGAGTALLSAPHQLSSTRPPLTHLLLLLPTCDPSLQECLRDARRVEAITGQQEDRENYMVPTRCAHCCRLLALAWAMLAGCGLIGLGSHGRTLAPLARDRPAAQPATRHSHHHPAPAHPSFWRWSRQLEERCRDLDITDLQPFFGSATFREAGFRLGADGATVLLARA